MNLIKLNLPDYLFNLRNLESKPEIFDIIRKKYVTLTPEEWVRQNFVRYLNEEKDFPKSFLAIEKEIIVNKLKKRGDIVVYNRELKPILIVECKSPNIKPNQGVFDQAARYNMALNVKYFIITNGLNHICVEVDKENNSYYLVQMIPNYKDIS